MNTKKPAVEFKPGVRENIVGRPQDVKDEALLSGILANQVVTKAVDMMQESMNEAIKRIQQYVEGLPEERKGEATLLMLATADLISSLIATKVMHTVYVSVAGPLDAIMKAAEAAKDSPEEPAATVSDEVRALANDLISRAGKG